MSPAILVCSVVDITAFQQSWVRLDMDSTHNNCNIQNQVPKDHDVAVVSQNHKQYQANQAECKSMTSGVQINDLLQGT